MADAKVLHIVDADVWRGAQTEGRYQPSSLAVEGFIHFSTFEQFVATANRYYRGTKNLVVLVVDTSRLDVELKYELSPHHPDPFPHLYGPLRCDAVVASYAIPPRGDGTFALPEDLIETPL